MAKWSPKKLSVTLESADEAEHFLQALLASRDRVVDDNVEALIEGVSSVLEPHRAEELRGQIAARDEAAKSW